MKNNEGNQKENKLDTKGNVEINNNEVEIVSQNLQSTIDHITKNVAPIIEMQNRVEHIQEQIQGVFQPIIQRYNREFDTSKLKRILQSLETGLFFCQIFVFII